MIENKEKKELPKKGIETNTFLKYVLGISIVAAILKLFGGDMSDSKLSMAFRKLNYQMMLLKSLRTYGYTEAVKTANSDDAKYLSHFSSATPEELNSEIKKIEKKIVDLNYRPFK
ncbi:MAG: hypothetical protein JSS82_09850 [Bacteroidetes bacterium]|nr:hypothetical protein [Bacteroidota bacterium]